MPNPHAVQKVPVVSLAIAPSEILAVELWEHRTGPHPYFITIHTFREDKQFRYSYDDPAERDRVFSAIVTWHQEAMARDKPGSDGFVKGLADLEQGGILGFMNNLPAIQEAMNNTAPIVIDVRGMDEVETLRSKLEQSQRDLDRALARIHELVNGGRLSEDDHK